MTYRFLFLAALALATPAYAGDQMPEEAAREVDSLVRCDDDSLQGVVPAGFAFLRHAKGGPGRGLLFEDRGTGISLVVTCSAWLRPEADAPAKFAKFLAGKPGIKASDGTGLTLREARGETMVLSYFLWQDLRALVLSFAFPSSDAKAASAAERARLAVFSALAKQNPCPDLRIPDGFCLGELGNDSRTYFAENSGTKFTLTCGRHVVADPKQFLAEEKKRLQDRMNRRTSIVASPERNEIRTSLEDQGELTLTYHLAKGSDYYVVALLSPKGQSAESARQLLALLSDQLR